jgi:PKD repeat protein
MKRFFTPLLLALTALFTVQLQAQSPCNANFQFVVNGATVNFYSSNGNTNPGPVRHFWNFGNGKSGDGVNPIHTYTAPGIYNVTHVVRDTLLQCADTVTKAVRIDSVPPAPCNMQIGFEMRKDSINGLMIYFSSNVLNAPSSNRAYIWRFGDGTTSNLANPVKTYSQAGTYTVCLVVESGANCRKEVCKVLTLSAPPPPPPTCTVRPAFQFKRDSIQPNKVYFTNTSLNASATTQFIWKFGDGTTSLERNPTKVYAQAGAYQVCLVAESAGCRRDTCMIVQVNGPTPNPCQNRSGFKFAVYPNNQLEYKFTADSINTSWQYKWNFGDGTTSTSPAPGHRFAQSGQYRVCLTVITSANCQSTTCKEIRVGAACDSLQVRYEKRRNPQVPNQVYFKVVSNQTIARQRWTIYRNNGTNTIIEANNPAYTFRDTGTYRVCVLATAANGCKREYCDTVRITQVVNTNGGFLTVFPNPASQVVYVEVKLERPEPIQVRILNSFGIAVSTRTFTGVAGPNILSIPVANLTPGYYTLEVKVGGRTLIGRFQKI